MGKGRKAKLSIFSGRSVSSSRRQSLAGQDLDIAVVSNDGKITAM
jgi:hypothetical protein